MNNSSPWTNQSARSTWRGFAWTLLVLLLALLVLFHRSLDSTQILFSSDGPLGANQCACTAMPGAYTGIWQDVNWVGNNIGSALPSLTYLLLWFLKPVGFARFYAPLSLLVLGLCIWVLLRQLRFHPAVCALGSLAAALNTDFLSYACWGLGTLPMTVAAASLAIAALVAYGRSRPWLGAIMAGVAVGLSLMEGLDTGAIFSLYVGAFLLFQALTGVGPVSNRIGLGVARMALVAVVAGVTAFHVLSVLIGTQIKGVVGMQQDPVTRSQRWNEATQWSLPKSEALRLIIAGSHGYRLDTPGGGAYWGAVGRDPVWDDYFASPNPDPAKRPEGRLLRHSGAGLYAGVLVVLVALWAAIQPSRRGSSPFDAAERRSILFWDVVAGVSLLLAFGRHAPFYQFVYALPYFSTIRNPVKFLHPFSLAVVILSAYGLEGMWRLCAARAKTALPGVFDQLRQWWHAKPNPDRGWTIGCCVTVMGVFCAWLIYAGAKGMLVAHLQQVGFPDAATGSAMASHSVSEVGMFGLLLAMSVACFTLVLSGVFAGKRAIWAVLIMGVVISIDLLRASSPWVIYWDRREKYASNAIFDVLRQRPYEKRVVVFPFPVNEQMGLLQQLYHAEWIQHGFRYYDIHTLDVVQEPRVAAENQAFRKALYSSGASGQVRLWELTNTRFVLGLAGGFTDLLNQQFDPALRRFRPHTLFTLTQQPKSGAIGVQTNTTGPFALIEFTGALPRAALYNNWQVNTNDEVTLQTLASPAFDPKRQVLVSNADLSPPPAESAATNQDAGTVEFVQYAPKDVLLRVRAETPALLLLNDKHDPHWTVTVDDKPGRLLRCNYLMRGVIVPPGEHTVRFRFSTSLLALGVSIAALAAGFALLLFICMPLVSKPD